MKSQAALLGVKQAALSPESDLWRHAAVRPLADHEAPLAEHQVPRSDGRDFSRVPVHASRPDGGHAEVSCPLTPRRCPFGGACHTCPTHVQAKLAVSQPGDEYEREADHAGEVAVRMPEPQLQLRAAGQVEPDSVPPIVHEVLRSPGQPLDAETRAAMEPRFGHDFSQVRVHTDAQAAESARAVNALAYTVGRNIIFNVGRYAPHMNDGQRLIAHELTHVVQQSQSAGTTSGTLEIGRSGSSEEAEAAHNEPAIHKSTRTVGIGLQRHDDPNQYLGGTNMVFDSQGEARMAAIAEAAALGPGHTITHDPMPTRGLPHYHVVDPGGSRVRGHFFYTTRRRRRSYKVDWSTVRSVVITLGLSLAMIAVIIAALADPEPASKLALAGLSAAMIAIVLGRFSGEETGDQKQA